MRTRRIKVREQTAVYHCVTRCVGGAMLLDDVAKEVLRKQLWQVADFCGVEVLTYCVMSNHFHVLVRVPKMVELSDAELVRRFALFYGEDRGRVDTLEADLKAGGEYAEVRRQQILKRMGDVSVFMKELKQRFSIWYNKSHRRYGTLWAERFKSALVENTAHALKAVAAYIDLNPVRAGMVDDPANYRWCGYAEAVVGHVKAKRGLATVVSVKGVEVYQAYRVLLFGVGQGRSKEKDVVLNTEQAREVIRKGGKLPLHQLLRLRVRYFTDGAVLGTEAFVKEQIIRLYPPSLEDEFSTTSRRTAPRKIRGLSDELPLRSLRALRG